MDVYLVAYNNTTNTCHSGIYAVKITNACIVTYDGI